MNRYGVHNRWLKGHSNRSGVDYVIEDRGHTTPCWVWNRGPKKGKYGQAKGGLAHRVYYERAHGPIPSGLHIDHLCRVTRCVNPDHLEPVTLAENNRRSSLAKLDHASAADIRERFADSGLGPVVFANSVCAEYGVNERTIRDVVNNVSWLEVAA